MIIPHPYSPGKSFFCRQIKNLRLAFRAKRRLRRAAYWTLLLVFSLALGFAMGWVGSLVDFLEFPDGYFGIELG